MLVRLVALICFLSATSSLFAQQALSSGLPQAGPIVELQPPPENAWIDLRQHPRAASRPQSAPSWVEAVNITSTTGTDGAPRSVFRIRVTPPSGDYQIMFFRI